MLVARRDDGIQQLMLDDEDAEAFLCCLMKNSQK
jgi:hypothetical protein